MQSPDRPRLFPYQETTSPEPLLRGHQGEIIPEFRQECSIEGLRNPRKTGSHFSLNPHTARKESPKPPRRDNAGRITIQRGPRDLIVCPAAYFTCGWNNLGARS